MPQARRWIAAAGLLAAALAIVDVSITEPRVHVRWSSATAPDARMLLEERYGLSAGELVQETTWRYALLDRSSGNLGALLSDPAVADTAYIDRAALTVPAREISVRVRTLEIFGPAPAELIQLQTLVIWLGGMVLLFASRASDIRRRRLLALLVLGAVAVAAYAMPLRQPIRMGDSHTYVSDRHQFESYSGVHSIRFEAHLSHAVLGRIDAMLGRSADAPGRALDMLMRGATTWFFTLAVLIGTLERWSPHVLRYLGLVVLAPATLMYFGYRELGHLSLNAAAFPLIARGLAERSRRLEWGSALAGFGAAWHGFGLLSIAGGALAALAARARPSERVASALRVVGWGTAMYLGWLAIYLVALNLPVTPGHAAGIPFRPWFADVVADRVNVAIVSARGLRDVAFSGWVAGAPLLAVALVGRRESAGVIRAAIAYAIPSSVFLLMFWPIQGLAVEMDLVFAGFPALYALAWVCASDSRRTVVAAALLMSAHFAFWRIVFDAAFVNSRLG